LFLTIASFFVLWTTADEFYRQQYVWLDGSFTALVADKVDAESAQMSVSLQRALHVLKDIDGVGAATMQLKAQVRLQCDTWRCADSALG
jgi:hypothetical protein